MKQVYPRLLPLIIIPLLLLVAGPGFSQMCPDGSLQGQTAYSHTVSIPGGMTSTNIKFPKFQPANGMVTCMQLCITITGVINSLTVENDNDNGSTPLNVFYNRTDMLSGPGITPITNSVNTPLYGPLNLTPDDNVDYSGTDYFAVYNDTVMNKITICQTISDTASLSQFYGSDSLSYSYSIAATVNMYYGGNIKNSAISTTASSTVSLSYCTCPAIVLPINVYGFEVSKILANKANLTWSGYDDPHANYKYIAEVSRDGRSFSPIGSFAKHESGNTPYTTNYTATSGSGAYYFRIKQVYSNGYTRFSNIRMVELENSVGPKFSIYPNPSTGIVGIKFDNSAGGQYGLKIFNALGQVVVTKNLSISSSSYNQVAKLEPGVYWIRLTDNDSQESSSSQIIIK